MTSNHDSGQKFLVNCRDGANNVERATISLILAVSASKTSETAMFMTTEAADLCVRGGVDGLHAEGYEPVSDLLHQYLENGGRIWLCPACANAKGITGEDVIDGVEIAGAPRTMAFLAEGARLLA